MQNEYLAEVTTLLEESCPNLSTSHRLDFKNVFGAVGGYANGRIFISCGRFGVALRLPPEVLEKLFEEDDVKRLRYFPKGHIKKEYAVLPKRILEDKPQFRRLLDQSIRALES